MSRIVVLTLCLLASVTRLHGQQPDELLEALRPPPAPTSEASAPGRPASDPAAAELAALGALLQPLLERAEWPGDLWLGLGGDTDVAAAEARNPLPAVSARLALFERRFGTPPQESLGWAAFQALARQLLGRMEAAPSEPVGDGALDHRERVEPPWLVARTLLLEILGRRDEARALLLHESPRWLWPGHWMIEAQLVYVLVSERALHCDRAGAPDEALRWSLASWDWGTSDGLADHFGHHRTGIDWVLAHHAVLLAEAGEWTAVRTVLSDLERLRPDAAGTRFAQSWLAEALDAHPATAAQLVSLNARTDGRRADVYAVGVPHDAATWRVLAAVEWLQAAYDRGEPHPGSELRALAPEDPRAAELIAALPPHANPFR